MLPLTYKTPARWALTVLADPFALLSDHAYLERKAASNALDLLNRWPEPRQPKEWVSVLTSIARDEAMHLHLVTKLIQKKGGRLSRLHRSQYAGDLRKLVRMGLTPEEVFDRLLVSALIEARSCERFELLAEACKDKEMARMYKSLSVSEKGHYKIFHHLAAQLVSKQELKLRWTAMLEAEAEIIQNQPIGPGLHSRCP